MAELTMRDVVKLQSGLNKISSLSEKGDSPVQAEVSMRMALLIDYLTPYLEKYQKTREKLLRKHGNEIFKTDPTKVDKDGKQVKEPTNEFSFKSDSDREKYNESFEKMMDERVDVSETYFLKISEIEDYIKSVNDLRSLFPILINDKEEEKPKKQIKKSS